MNSHKIIEHNQHLLDDSNEDDSLVDTSFSTPRSSLNSTSRIIPSGYLYGAPHFRKDNQGFQCLHTCSQCKGNGRKFKGKQKVILHMCLSNHKSCNSKCKMFNITEEEFRAPHNVLRGSFFEYEWSSTSKNVDNRSKKRKFIDTEDQEVCSDNMDILESVAVMSNQERQLLDSRITSLENELDQKKQEHSEYQEHMEMKHEIQANKIRILQDKFKLANLNLQKKDHLHSEYQQQMEMQFQIQAQTITSLQNNCNPQLLANKEQIYLKYRHDMENKFQMKEDECNSLKCDFETKNQMHLDYEQQMEFKFRMLAKELEQKDQQLKSKSNEELTHMEELSQMKLKLQTQDENLRIMKMKYDQIKQKFDNQAAIHRQLESKLMKIRSPHQV
jgi:hypothetical protein